MKCLGEDDAVVRGDGERAALLQISDECGVRVRGIDVDYLAVSDAVAAELRRVRVVLNLQDRSVDAGPVGVQERFDVSPVDRLPSIEAVVVAQGLNRQVRKRRHDLSLTRTLAEAGWAWIAITFSPSRAAAVPEHVSLNNWGERSPHRRIGAVGRVGV